MPTSAEPTDTLLAEDREARNARLVLLLFVVGLVVALVGGGLLVVAKRRHDRVNLPAVESQAAPSGAVQALGPVKGAAIDAYIGARNQALANVGGRRLAVVSFTRYATEAEARRAVGNADVLALLAAAPGGQPATVTTGLDRWAADARRDALRQRAEIQRLLDSGTVDDPDYLSFYRSEVARFTRVADSADANRPLVFAVVVSAEAGALRAIARAPGVRMVDVDDTHGDTAAPGAAFTGLRPEETAVAGTPPTRP